MNAEQTPSPVAPAPAVPVPMIRLLAIDAWREGSGWTWNNWFPRGSVPLEWVHLKPRQLLAALRQLESVTVPAPGYAAIEDDGFNVVVMHRTTGQPVLALEYGRHQPH